MGMNFQKCYNQIFAALDFSFEKLYQSVRRSYRFGQEKDVNIHLITLDTMENVIGAIKDKEAQFIELRDNVKNEINKKEFGLVMDYERIEIKNENYHIYMEIHVLRLNLLMMDLLTFQYSARHFRLYSLTQIHIVIWVTAKIMKNFSIRISFYWKNSTRK